MYTVVIVDDEPWALQGLAEIIDWNNEGFSIIGQFTDPDEAFEFLCKKEPDVVFTDIRMPGLSGLDLIEMSRVKGLNCEFVLISSYEDFEAAQKGIRLHVVEEILDGASVACFSVGNKEESSVLWHKEVPGAGLCHCTIIGNSLYVSGYTGGTLTGLNAISGQVMFYKEFLGHGSNTLRQEKSHIHSAQPTPDGSRLLVADLGTDRLYKFVMDAKIGLMLDEEQPYFQVRAGQGPRHFAFHPNGKWLYLVTELDCSLLVFRYQNNRLNQVGEYSLREKGDPDSSLAADIHVSPDGKFLYVSVRGPGCLQGFEIQKENGLLNPLGRFSTGGWCPRSFHISPDGRYVAVANQELGTLEVFSRENTNGQLGKLLCCVEVPHVSCVKWRNEFLR